MAEHHKKNHVGSALRACTWNNVKEKKQINNRWKDIPEDALEMIMKRLSLKDYVRLRAVCSSWRAIVSNAIANKHFCHPLPELPRLLLLRQKSLVLNSSKQKHKYCCGTVEGWLILNERVGKGSFVISFFNPVTNTTILVPSVLKFLYPNAKDLSLPKMVASCEPNSSSKSDCSLVGFFNDYSHIAYCKLNDMSWNMIEVEKEFRVVDVEIVGGKLYVIAISSTNKSLLVYDLPQDSSSNPPKPRVLAKLPPSPNPTITQSGTKRIVSGGIRYYVAKDEASGELFLIYRFCNFTYEVEHVNCFNLITEYVIAPKITSVEAFMLDTKKETTTDWNKVKKLGDKVLFVSFRKSIVTSKTALNRSKTIEVIEGNSIYFAAGNYACPSNPSGGIQLGKICLTDNIIKNFSVKKSNHQTVPYPCWFLPSL